MRTVLLLGITLSFLGCAAGDAAPFRAGESGVQVALDRSAPESQRLRAVNDLALEGQELDAQLAALHVLAWSDRHPMAVRTAAIDRLRTYDVDGFWRAAERWLVSVDHAEVVAALAERAVEDERSELVPKWIRRWAKASPRVDDEERSEYRAVAGLTKESEPSVVLEEALDANDPRTAAAAWTVLMRWQDEAEMRRRVAGWPAGVTGLRGDLRAASATFGALPVNGEELAWLSALRQRGAFWARWEGTQQNLAAEAKAGVALRHVSVIMRLPEDIRTSSRSALRERVEVALQGAQTWKRDREPAGQQAGDGLIARLSWADLGVVWTVQRAMRDTAVQHAWFEQADRDRLDLTTEYGGVLTWDQAGRFEARAFPPAQKEGDRKYFTPPALVAAMYTGLTHYHFHAQSHRNAAYAGPGPGDLDFTEALRANTLVLTFVDRDTLDVDLALPGSVVVDLGVVVRPRGDVKPD